MKRKVGIIDFTIRILADPPPCEVCKWNMSNYVITDADPAPKGFRNYAFKMCGTCHQKKPMYKHSNFSLLYVQGEDNG